MSKTPFSKKCEIVGSVWYLYGGSKEPNEGWDLFFRSHDIGAPLSFMVWRGIATIKTDKKHLVEETWSDLCKVMLLNPDDNFENVDDFFNKANESRQLMYDLGIDDEG